MIGKLQVYLERKDVRDVCIGVGTYGLLFKGGLGGFQWVSRSIGLTSGKGWISQTGGLLGVGLTGYAAALVMNSLFPGRLNTESPQAESLFYGVGGAGIFRALGMEFKSVLPSSLVEPGAFAKKSIGATMKYADSNTRKEIQAIGNKYGCHTCGKKRGVDTFICDHQPPNAKVKRKLAARTSSVFQRFLTMFKSPVIPQQFLPHCPDCSSIQSKLMNPLTTDSVNPIRLHFRPKGSHLTGFILGLSFFKTSVASALDGFPVLYSN